MTELVFAALIPQSTGWAAGIVVFFALLIGHAFGDFAFQGDFLACAKNHQADTRRFFGGEPPPPFLWVHALSAHSFIHAGIVWLITGSVIFGAAEFILHWSIDFAKSAKLTHFTADQLFHMACKIPFAALIASGATWIYWSP